MPRADRGGRQDGPPDPGSVAELLWRTSAEPDREARHRLSARLIVDTAVSLADAEGLGPLSMQRVAGELGCTAMALYRHVPGKDHLLAAMVDTATGRPPAPADPPGGWRAEVETWVDALWDLYLRHPWVTKAPTTGAPVGPNELAWFEALLSPLARSGLDRAELVPIATFVSGAVRDLARVATELDPAGAAAYGEVLARHLDPARFPVLCSLAGTDGFEEDEDGDVTPIVRSGVRRLLDGIEARPGPH
ncbi:TetR/AcrR family transcriptional regulator [Streptomyces erythrochromogenes]|uniref:TetR/AcrR family transcriptional regulator n=1 Tax=Streptomyces erythrochromogenes TaxID=285574 RepID=UPI0036787A5A